MIRDKAREVRNSQNSKDFVSQAKETGEFGARQWLASLSWVDCVYCLFSTVCVPPIYKHSNVFPPWKRKPLLALHFCIFSSIFPPLLNQVVKLLKIRIYTFGLHFTFTAKIYCSVSLVCLTSWKVFNLPLLTDLSFKWAPSDIWPGLWALPRSHLSWLPGLWTLLFFHLTSQTSLSLHDELGFLYTGQMLITPWVQPLPFWNTDCSLLNSFPFFKMQNAIYSVKTILELLCLQHLSQHFARIVCQPLPGNSKTFESKGHILSSFYL